MTSEAGLVARLIELPLATPESCIFAYIEVLAAHFRSSSLQLCLGKQQVPCPLGLLWGRRPAVGQGSGGQAGSFRGTQMWSFPTPGSCSGAWGCRTRFCCVALCGPCSAGPGFLAVTPVQSPALSPGPDSAPHSPPLPDACLTCSCLTHSTVYCETNLG